MYDPVHDVILESDTEGLLGLVSWYLRYNPEQRRSVLQTETKTTKKNDANVTDNTKGSLEHEHMRWL